MLDPIRSPLADDLHDIDVEHVFFRYADADVLADVDLRIGGGIACLLGRNGAGKSSLLRLLAGVVAPHRGCVRIGGEPVHRRPSARALVGYLPHRPALYPTLTVADNLRFWGGALGLPPEQVTRRTAALARWIDVAPLLATRAAGLSRGQQQAVALVRTFLRDSPVLLLDEPATGLDGAAVDGLHAYLRERAAAGAVVVVSTHDYEQAWRLGEQFLMVTPARSVESLAKSCVDRGDEREVELYAAGPGRDELLRELAAPHRLEGDRCIVQVTGEASLDALVLRALRLGLRVDGIRPVESGGRWLERWMQ
jgi:ABC-2 type transport system ATP-binding protein